MLLGVVDNDAAVDAVEAVDAVDAVGDGCWSVGVFDAVDAVADAVVDAIVDAVVLVDAAVVVSGAGGAVLSFCC